MKPKVKIIILIAIGTSLTIFPIFTSKPIAKERNSNYHHEFPDIINFDNQNLQISAISGKIHINDNDPSSNWSVAKNLGICTGNGTYSEPYLIEDLVIDGEGSESCILIENSNVFFNIENCTFFNSGSWDHAGIKLIYVNNGTVTENNCSENNKMGILLLNSDNNTIIGNTVKNNGESGIYLSMCNNNSILTNLAQNNTEYGIGLSNSEENRISGNNANDNYRGIELQFSSNNSISKNSVKNNDYGIHLYSSPANTVSNNTIQKNVLGITIDHICEYNVISGNIMYECGIDFLNPCWTFTAVYIDDTNIVNGKKVYFYKNRDNLRAGSFTNAGQVILVNCNNSLISNLNTSYCTAGISLYYCYHNEISENIVNDNSYSGIQLYNSDYNTISGNSANYNYYGIKFYRSDANTISENTANNNTSGIYISSQSLYNNILENIANYNSCGIQLYSSISLTISGNTANYNTYGLYLSGGSYNTVSRNTINNNTYGIYLRNSDFNTISGNTLLGNNICIVEDDCEGNIFYDNGSCIYGIVDKGIPGYNPFVLLGLIPFILINLKKKVKSLKD